MLGVDLAGPLSFLAWHHPEHVFCASIVSPSAALLEGFVPKALAFFGGILSAAFPSRLVMLGVCFGVRRQLLSPISVIPLPHRIHFFDPQSSALLFHAAWILDGEKHFAFEDFAFDDFAFELFVKSTALLSTSLLGKPPSTCFLLARSSILHRGQHSACELLFLFLPPLVPFDSATFPGILFCIHRR